MKQLLNVPAMDGRSYLKITKNKTTIVIMTMNAVLYFKMFNYEILNNKYYLLFIDIVSFFIFSIYLTYSYLLLIVVNLLI